MRLANAATLRTVVPGLANSEEFVRAVLGNMTGYYKDCQVRLACDSNPKCPDYLIEMLFFEGDELVGAQSMSVHKGRTHQGVLADETNLLRVWSSEAMTFREVQLLIKDIRELASRP